MAQSQKNVNYFKGGERAERLLETLIFLQEISKIFLKEVINRKNAATKEQAAIKVPSPEVLKPLSSNSKTAASDEEKFDESKDF